MIGTIYFNHSGARLFLPSIPAEIVETETLVGVSRR